MTDPEAFERALREWSALREMYDPRSGVTATPRRVGRANVLARRFGKLAASLSQTVEGRAAIERLMRDADPSVRSIAASYALGWGAAEAVAVLESIAGLPGVTGLGAEYALRRHRAGQGTPVKVHPD